MSVTPGQDQTPGQVCDFDSAIAETLEIDFFGTYSFGSGFSAIGLDNGVRIRSVDASSNEARSTVTVASGATFDVSGTALDISGPVDLAFDGTILNASFGLRISYFGDAPSDVRIGGVINAEDGAIRATLGDGGRFNADAAVTSDFSGYRVTGDDARIDIGGTVEAQIELAAGVFSGSGVSAGGTGSTINVTATVQAGQVGAFLDGTDNVMTIDGDITSQGTAVFVDNDLGASSFNTAIVNSTVTGVTGGVTARARNSRIVVGETGTVQVGEDANGTGMGIFAGAFGIIDGLVEVLSDGGIGAGVTGGTLTVNGRLESQGVGVSMNTGTATDDASDLPSVTVAAGGYVFGEEVGIRTTTGGASITVLGTVESDGVGIAINPITLPDLAVSLTIGSTAVINAATTIEDGGGIDFGGTDVATPSVLNLTNNGDLNGDVDLGGGADSVTNLGTIRGRTLLGDGDDRYTGNDTEETVFDGAGADRVDLRGGNDILVASADAGDTYDGGTGRDLIDLGALSGGFSINLFSNAVTGDGVPGFALSGFEDVVGGAGADTMTGTFGRNTFAGQDGDDTLYGDGLVPLDAGSVEAQIYRAYQAVFDRAPDAGGFAAVRTELLIGNLTQEALITAFVGSDEFQNTYGELSNRAFIEQLYRNTLDREGDAEGIDAFTAELDNGGLSRAEAVIAFANSDEFLVLTQIPSAAFASSVSGVPGEYAVFRAYQAVFDRAPDFGGFEAFTGELRAGNLDLEDVVQAFTDSAEFQSTYGALADQAFVELLYQNVFGREGDAGGVAAFTNALQDGTLTRAQVVVEFVQSFEFRQATDGAAAQFVADTYAERSSDFLIGGRGDDVLFGGRGEDVFAVGLGTDIVLDFQQGADRLELADLGDDFDTFAEVQAVLSQNGNDTVFDFGNGNMLVLQNVQASTLTEADFLFDFFQVAEWVDDGALI